MLKIDLHGLTHDKAILKVEDCLIMNQLCKYGEIELITGSVISKTLLSQKRRLY